MSNEAGPSTETPLRRVKSAGDVPPTDSRRLPSLDLDHLPTSDGRITAPPRVHIHVDDRSTTQIEEQPPPLEPLNAITSSVNAANETANHASGGELNTSGSQSSIRRMLTAMGYGRGASKARRLHVQLVWNVGWGTIQVIVITTVLAYGSRRKSPTMPLLNQWEACERPLGVWSILWIFRVLFSSGVTYWGYTRQMQSLRLQNQDDPEANRRNSATDHTRLGPARSRNTRSASDALRSPTAASTHSNRNREPESPVLPNARLYARMTLLSSLITLSWFLTAHILEYTSVYTCRFSAPYMWYLVFGILCIMYFMVLEVLLLGFIFFIVAPIVFLFWNIFLICLGRHPIVNPHHIKPEIDKLPKSIVDAIPLVMYMPFPPEATEEEKKKVPEAIYKYPPAQAQKAGSPKQRRFRFLRIRKKKRSSEDESEEKTSDLPFVMLETNRAACSICLCDFEEPNTSKAAEATDDQLQSQSQEQRGESKGQAVPVEDIEEEQRPEELKLADVEGGAQPLRLLACGHVFHKTCLDPWLLDVSGRCPVCQRKVELPMRGRKSIKQATNSGTNNT